MRASSVSRHRAAAARAVALAAIMVAMFFLLSDKYVFRDGIWVGPPTTLTWEPLASACLLAMLIVVLSNTIRRNARAGRMAGLESAGFVLLNAILIARDGACRFADAGYAVTNSGLVAVVVGIIARLIILLVLRGSRRVANQGSDSTSDSDSPALGEATTTARQ